MVDFNEFENILEGVGPVRPFKDQDRQHTWSIVHSLGPILKARIKKLSIELSDELSLEQPFNRVHLDAAVRQILIDMADGHESVV